MFRMRLRSFLALAVLLAGGHAAAAAGAPDAIVASVEGEAGGVQPLDYLAVGRIVTLGADSRLVIDYLSSCVRETIVGGTVKIGKGQSASATGRVERSRFDCDRGGQAALLADQERPAQPGFVPPPRPEGQPHQVGIGRTIYSTSPLFDLGNARELTIEPLDPAGNAMKLSIAPGELLHGRFYDFAAAGRRLEAGGIYRASVRGHSVVFWVDPLAAEGAGPIGGRLIRL